MLSELQDRIVIRPMYPVRATRFDISKSLGRKTAREADLQIHHMPKMTTLCYPTAYPVSSLQDSYFAAVLEKYICASKSCEPGADDADVNLPRFCGHGT